MLRNTRNVCWVHSLSRLAAEKYHADAASGGHGIVQFIGIVGASGSGKTQLVTRLIPALVARGARVSTIKHAHHGFEPDTPGKDSHRHRLAGAHEVLLVGPERWALFHEAATGDGAEPDAPLALLSPVDIVLVEGWKRADWPRIEVWRGIGDQPPLAATDLDIAAVACDRDPGAAVRVPVLPLNDAGTIADWILDLLARTRVPVADACRRTGAG